MSNTTNGITKDQGGGFLRGGTVITEKYLPAGSELTPKVGTGGAYSGILEARGAINGSQMSIFSNDMILARANQKQNGSANYIHSKAGEVAHAQASTTLESNDNSKKEGNLLCSKKSSIDVTALLEKIQSQKFNNSPTVQGNNPTTGDNLQI